MNDSTHNPVALYPDWLWPDIKAALEKRGHTLATVARSIGMDDSATRKVKKRPCPRAQAAIAQAIGVSPLAIWPARYRPDGTPIALCEWMKLRGVDQNGNPVTPKDITTNQGESQA